MIARVAAVFSSSRDWKERELQFAPDYSQQQNKTLQVTNTSRTKLGRKKHVVQILLGGEGGAVPQEYPHWQTPSSQELRLEKDWAQCLALTTTCTIQHPLPVPRASNSQNFEMRSTGAIKRFFNLNNDSDAYWYSRNSRHVSKRM